MSQCKIFLENYTGVYYAGAEIRGRVECYFDSETKIRGVKIRLKCDESNSWTGTETYRDSENKEHSRFITLTGNNRLFFREQMLHNGVSDTVTLPPGRHAYPFDITLPYNIPASYNGPHGAIAYALKAIVDRPLRGDYEDKFMIIVQSPIDFNRLSKELQRPVSYDAEKTVCCWCCAGGNITLTVELPKTGFAVGEVIDIVAKIVNLSNSSVENLKCEFTKRIEYKVDTPKRESKYDQQTIQAFTEHGVGAHGDHSYNLQLLIPAALEVPNFESCTLFEATYKLKFSCEFGGCTMDMDIDIWPTLGHIQCGSAPAASYPPGEPFGAPPGPGYPPFNAAGPAPYPVASAAPYPPMGGPVYPPAPAFNPGFNVFAGKGAEGGMMPTAPPSAPAPELPPPSYDQAQHMERPPYPPQ